MTWIEEIREFIRPFREKGQGEGSINNVQAAWLWHWCEDNKPKRVLEIGFNAGISTEVFLRSVGAVVHSFDLFQHPYVPERARRVMREFRDRFFVFKGDSKCTVPEFASGTYDLIFIDGDHRYEGAKADIENCRAFAHRGTTLIIDDYKDNKQGKGVVKAVNECVEKSIINKGDAIVCPITGKGWYVTKYNVK